MEKKIAIKYVGLSKRRIAWSCMGKLYTYSVKDGDVIYVPESQLNKIFGFGAFEKIIVSNKPTKAKTKKKDKINNKIKFKDEAKKILKEKEIKVEKIINEGNIVKVISDTNKYFGKTGTVIKITTGGVCRVKLDNDTAKYRRLDDDILEVV